MSYTWDQTPLVVGSTNTVVGASAFGKNSNNGNTMQPDAYYSDMFLERKRFKGDDLVYAYHAETRTIKKGLDTINLRRYQPLKAHIVPLVEGLPPIGDRAHGKAIIAKTRQYGRFMEFTDLFEYKVADPVIEEYTVELADLANETIDMLAQAALLAEAQVFFAAAKDEEGKLVAGVDRPTSAGVLATQAATHSMVPSFDDLRIIKLTMEVAKVKSIGGSYVVLASPAVFFDLQTDPTIRNFMDYGNTNAPIVTDSIPSVYGLAVKKAATAKVELTAGVASKTSVHHTIVLGAKAYSKVEIADGGNVQFFSKELGSAGTLDPLNQRRTMGWKINAIGFKVTDPDAVVDYMSVPSQAEIITDNFDYVAKEAAQIGISPSMQNQTLEVLGVNTTKLSIADDATGDAINAELAKPIVKEQFANIKTKDTAKIKAQAAKEVEVAVEDKITTP